MRMTGTNPTAFTYLQNSQKAYEKGDVLKARHWARLAVSSDPLSEEAWLWMGAIASPQASVGYLQRALEINPASTRARQGLVWARGRISAGQMAETRAHKVHRSPQAETLKFLPETLAGLSEPAPAPAQPQRSRKPANKRTRMPAYLSLSGALALFVVLCLAVGLVTVFTTTSARAYLLGQGTPVAAASGQNWANAHINKPGPTATPQASATPAPTSTPAATNTPAASATPQASPTPAVSADASLTPLPTDTALPPTQVVKAPAAQPAQADQGTAPGGTGQRILVSISKQHMYVYDGDTLVYSFVVSTGLHNSTAAGTFKVLDKIPNAYGSTWDLWMPDWLGIYYSGSLENGIHALPILSNGQTLWAGLLGQPASFGCIILGTADAQTLYNWVEVGTPVIIER